MKNILSLITLFLILVGCNQYSSIELINDENTSPDVSTIENLDADMSTYHYQNDNMDRGNHDYFDETLVIDPNYEQLSRGDVVLFEKENGEKSISRIVALQEEIIEIKTGQIYIDDKKLDTFYGKAHRVGLDKESYFEKMENEGNEYDKKGMMEVFEKNIKEIQLSDNEFYLISDDWFRGEMMVVEEENILGSVEGYKK